MSVRVVEHRATSSAIVGQSLVVMAEWAPLSSNQCSQGSVALRPRLESYAFVHLGSSNLQSPPRAPLNTSIYSFACKVAMAVIDAVPSLEELSLVDVCGQQCMPGIETNLAELLLTAAEATPDRVCLEVEGESYTFAQAAPP